MAEKLISKIPEGPLSEKWTKHKSQLRVVNPGNKRKLEIIVIGTGLGGARRAHRGRPHDIRHANYSDNC